MSRKSICPPRHGTDGLLALTIVYLMVVILVASDHMANLFCKIRNFLTGGLTRHAVKKIALDACSPAMEVTQIYDSPQLVSL